jgi:hypothetical protein
MRYVVALGLLMLCCVSSDASGQVYYGGYRPYGGYGWGGAGWGWGGATAAGSYAAGMGQMIQAQGAYNQMTAVAATQMQEAKKLALDNKLKAAETNYQLQKINAQQRAEQARYAASLRAPAPPVKIPRLSASQLDPVTGQINWPPILLADDFQPQRGQLESLFALRSSNPSAVSFTQASALTNSMRDKLDAQITKFATSDFFSARHFLQSLANETRYTGFETNEQTAAK